MKSVIQLVIRLAIVMIIHGVLVYWAHHLMPDFISIFSHSMELKTIGLMIEMVVYLILLLFFLMITGNHWYSYFLSSLVYWVFQIASLVKIKFLHAPIIYYDFFHIDDLLRNIDVIDVKIIITIIFCMICFIALSYRAIRAKSNNTFRISATVLFSFILTLIVVNDGSIKKLLVDNKIRYKWNSNIITKSQKFGLSAVYIQSFYFSTKLQRPNDYSDKDIEQLRASSETYNSSNIIESLPPENVIILLVESFQDTESFPWKSNEEPTPTYQKMKRENAVTGQVIAPVFGGKSINSEFELLTGFSSIFLPEGSIPYKDFINHEIPSIARQFNENSYISNVVQVVAMHGYGYESIYNHLGFHNQFSLSRHDENVSLDPTGRFGSSQAIAKKLIEILDEQKKSFVFAFPNSSHAPWDIKDYPTAKIKATDIESKVDSDEVSAYFNALNHVDKLFKQLTQWASFSQERTVIVIVGDHQPSLNVIAGHQSNNNDRAALYKVPYLIWSNYESLEFKNIQSKLSMNMLGSYLMDELGVKTTGWFNFVSRLRKEFSVISVVIESIDGLQVGANLNDDKLLNQYQMLQYYYLSND